MRVDKSHFEGLRQALTASVVALLAAAPALTAAAAQPSASGFVPTVADYLSVYDALQNYRFGVEKHDQKMEANAFWEDAVRISVPTPGGEEIRMPLGGAPPPARAGQPGPNAGPPPGANAGAPAPGGGRGPIPNAASGAGAVEVWHLPLDSYIHFDSATRATHYEYFLSIYPQPEKKAEDGKRIPNTEARVSIVGWPGHYEDIFEKRHGEWRILQRKTMINQK